MAIAIRTGEETRQVQMVCLDELVGGDDVLRRVERLVCWEMVRDTAAPFYADFGRPGVDPVVLVKVFLVAAIRGVSSMRETLRIARVDLSIRRFLGYGLTEALPHHATFSYAQCVRFANSAVFEQLFTQVLASCRDAGLVDGSRLIVDATHVEADAALKSLRAELSVVDNDGDGDGRVDHSGGERPKLELAAPRSGPTPKRKASNATAVSRTDPEAKLRYKPGHRPHLVHRAQVATDPKRRVIVAVHAEPATGHEGDSLPVIINRARWLGHRVDEIVADAGYASDAVYADLADRGITAYILTATEHARPRERSDGTTTLQIPRRCRCRDRPDHPRRGSNQRDETPRRRTRPVARNPQITHATAARSDRDQPETPHQPRPGR